MKKMRMINQIRICTAAVLLVGSLTLQAQEENAKLNREMTLEREYNPGVQDADKVNRLPEVREPKITKQAIDYSSFTIPADPEKQLIILPSGNVMTAIPYNKRRGYFHFGGGMYMNINGDFGYHILNDEKDFLNVFISHRSTNGNIEYNDWKINESQKAKLNDNLAGVHFQHHFDFGTLRLGGNYGYTAFNYYGLPLRFIYEIQKNGMLSPGSHPVDRNKNQVNQTINAYTGIRSKENAMLGYLLDVAYRRFSQKYGWTTETDGVIENKFTLRGGFSSRFDSENQLVGIAGKADFFNYTYPTSNYAGDSIGYRNHAQITMTPYYRYEGDNGKLQLGANVMLITGDSSKLFFSPNISAETAIADKTVLYAQATGEIGANDAYAVSLLNRYTDHALMAKPSRTWLDAEIGLRSGFATGLWLEFFGGYKITENEIFFVPADYINKKHDFGNYSLVYQPDASLFRVGASLKYAYQQWVDFSLKGVYNNWSLRDGDGQTWLSGKSTPKKKAYGRPEMEINADLAIRPYSPLTLTFSYYLGANRHTLFLQKEIKLKNINDLNFTAAYNINNTLGLYVKVNNILNQQQELWYGYPMQKLNVMAGININF